MKQVEMATGLLFMAEDEIGDAFYIITEGICDVYQALGTPDERFLGQRGPGEFLGEGSLFDPRGRRTASVRAHTHMKLLRMTLEEFDLLLHQQPQLAYSMARLISQRQRSSDQAAIHDLAEKNRALEAAYIELKNAQAQIIEKEKMEKELQVAHSIQQSILPSHLPEVPGYTLGAVMVPARLVGGDLYDFILLPDGKLGVLIGDVSDKGVPAAIFMALVRSLVRAEAVRTNNPAAVIQTVNNHLLDMNDAGMFVTAVYGVLDVEKGSFHYARGGHEVPLLYNAAGEFTKIEQSRGLLLGVFPNPQLDQQTIHIPVGGTLLLYSDGATDMLNPAGEQFGRERLFKAVTACRRQNAQQLCTNILTTLQAFQAETSQADDITLVAVQA
jgi:serine phosphatase RsbU (regulator of sigma subunit)